MMKSIVVAIMLGLFFNATQAADVLGERYISQLTRSGNASIKQAAQRLYNSGEKSTEVLDVAAEVLLQRYPTAGNSDIDTLSWLAKVLGNSRNGRYHSTLQAVVDSEAHRKLRKYAKKALQAVGAPQEEQYLQGSVDLQALRNNSKTARRAKKAVVTNAEYQTGKVWVPFPVYERSSSTRMKRLPPNYLL